MTVENERSGNPADQPNREGFAGDPSTPEPDRRGSDPAEDVAVPHDDLTGPVSDALNGDDNR